MPLSRQSRCSKSMDTCKLFWCPNQSRSHLCAYGPVVYKILLKPMDHWKMKKSDQNKKKINEVKKTHTQGNEIAIAEWNCVQQRWCPAISKTTMPHHYNRLMQQRWCPAISTLPSHIHSHCTRTYIPKGVHPDPTCVPTARAYGPFAYGLLPTTHY